MHLVKIGITHETAPVEVRERIAFQADILPEALSLLNKNVAECVILSTCNRVEVYATVDSIEKGQEDVIAFIADYHRLSRQTLASHLDVRVDEEAVRHLFAVAGSIKSMVLGENQIQSQIKQALDIARAEDAIGPILSNLFQAALRVGKRVRNETAISEFSLSISNAAVRLVEKETADLASKKVLVVGSGKMGALAVKSLTKIGVQDVVIMNRTEENARHLAAELHLGWAGFGNLETEVARADVVISSTGAPGAVFTKEVVARAMAGRERTLLLVDIAVPRDVEPAVTNLKGVTLYNVDDLRTSIENNREKRCRELHKVESIVADEADKFTAWVHSLDVKPVIKGLRNLAEDIREQELQRALRRFENHLTDNDSQVVRELTCRIVNKMLHQPLVNLRQEAGIGNAGDFADTVCALFGLTETDDSLSRIESEQAA